MIEIVEGVKITICKDDLQLPHVNASYGTHSGIFSLRTGKMIKGNLPKEKVDQVESWIILNNERLMRLWEK